MAALEQVAANLDEKTEEVESRIKENSRIIAEMDQKTVSFTGLGIFLCINIVMNPNFLYVLWEPQN